MEVNDPNPKLSEKTEKICHHCEEVFINQNELVAHYRTHVNALPQTSGVNQEKMDEEQTSIEVCIPDDPQKESGEHNISHICQDCDTVFINQNELVAHYRTHVNALPQTSVVNQDEEQTSIEVCIPDDTQKESGEHNISHKCQDCDAVFISQNELVAHYLRHMNVLPQTSDAYREHLAHEWALNDSQANNTEEKPFICGLCHKGFKLKAYLNEHYQIHTGEKPHVCSVCGKGFTYKRNLLTHCVSHTQEKPFECNICHKTFGLKRNLVTHYMRHSGLKTHVCPICQRGFSLKNDLNLHISVHTDEKPHVCEICQKPFRLKKNLKNHYLTHTNLKPHACDVCHKGFSQRRDLDRHYLVHTGEKPFKCELCGKGFRRKTPLNSHYLIHSGEKPHVCQICDSAFTHRRNLMAHMNVHTKKAFKCKFCRKKFKLESELTKHSLTHTEPKRSGENIQNVEENAEVILP